MSALLLHQPSTTQSRGCRSTTNPEIKGGETGADFWSWSARIWSVISQTTSRSRSHAESSQRLNVYLWMSMWERLLKGWKTEKCCRERDSPPALFLFLSSSLCLFDGFLVCSEYWTPVKRLPNCGPRTSTDPQQSACGRHSLISYSRNVEVSPLWWGFSVLPVYLEVSSPMSCRCHDVSALFHSWLNLSWLKKSRVQCQVSQVLVAENTAKYVQYFIHICTNGPVSVVANLFYTSKHQNVSLHILKFWKKIEYHWVKQPAF